METENVCCFEEYLWENQNAMEKAKTKGKAAIGIWLEEATYSDVEHEIEMCRIQGIKILGVLILE